MKRSNDRNSKSAKAEDLQSLARKGSIVCCSTAVQIDELNTQCMHYIPLPMQVRLIVQALRPISCTRISSASVSEIDCSSIAAKLISTKAMSAILMIIKAGESLSKKQQQPSPSDIQKHRNLSQHSVHHITHLQIYSTTTTA